MSPTSSSPSNLAVEFGVLPRTPASNRSKNSRTPTGKENSGSGSLHKRLFNSLRSRSRSFTRTLDTGSPIAKSVRRRKSIVDLLGFGSSSSQDNQSSATPADTRKTDDSVPKDNFAELFTQVPSRRRSLGNLLSPSTILGTITNKVSQKQSSTLQDIIPPVEVQSTKDNGDAPENIRDSKFYNAKCETEDEGSKPGFLQARLGGEDIDGMLLFEERLARMIDDINIDIPAKIATDQRRKSSYQQLMDEANNKTRNDRVLSTPDSLRPLLGDSRNETKENSRHGTPDSYLQLLIESCEKSQAQSPSAEDTTQKHVGTQPLVQEKHQSSSSDINPMSTTTLGYYPDSSAVQNSRQRTPDPFFQLADEIELKKRDADHSFLEPSTSQSTITEQFRGPSSQKSAFVQSVCLRGSAAELSRSPSTDTLNITERDMDLDLDTGLLIGYQYELRDSTPNIAEEAAELELHDLRPTVNVHEVIRTPSLVNGDPNFSQRHEEIYQRCSSLNLEPSAEWMSNSEKIAQGIQMTVARMTRNYHSASEEDLTWTPHNFLPGLDGTRANEITGSIQESVHDRFVENEEKVWESIEEGMQLLMENDVRTRRGNLSSETLVFDPDRVIEDLHGFQETSISPNGFISPVIRVEKRFLLESVGSSQELMNDTCEKSNIFSEFPSADLFLPLVDQVLEDSIVMRTPLDLFYAVRRATGMKIGSLGTFVDVDLCPEHCVPRRTSSFEAGFCPTKTILEIPVTPKLRPDSKNRRHILSAAVQVQFPSTVNLLQHTETYASKAEAIAAVHHYKLGELSNFCVYNAEKRTIIAHSIDSPVPNPADLARKGLDILWLPTNDETSDERRNKEGTAFAGSFNGSGSVSGTGSRPGDDSFPQWGTDSQINPLERHGNNEAESSMSVHQPDAKRYIRSENGISAEKPSADNDLSILGSETRRECSEDQSRFEMPEEDIWNDWKAVSPMTRSPVVTRLGKVMYQGKSPTKIYDGKSWESERSYSQNDYSRKYLSGSPSTSETHIEHIEFVSRDPEIGDESLFNGIMRASRSLDVDIADELGNPTERLSPPSQAAHSLTTVRGSVSVNDNKLDVVSTALKEQNTSSGSGASQISTNYVEHPSGYHFTAAKHLMATSECSRISSADTQSSSEEAMEILFDAAEYVKNDVGVHNHAVDTKPFIKFSGNIARRGIESRMEDTESTVTLNAVKSHDKFDIEPIDLQEDKENTITLEDMDLQLVGNVARNLTLIRRQKSKVGALVDIFQAHGIMPRTSLRTTASSVSPSFNRQQGDRNGESSPGMRIVSGNARKISGNFSASPHYILSPIPRAKTPSLPLDRRESRNSNIDTDESYTYGEVLRKVDKREFSRNDERWTNDSEMYG